ncbi:MAG: hypothetical protein GVY28_09020, partial [Alphaproteobacteria bacterium]|nr:hypothetical protein [Alphaproteobacteria bacterium]
RVFDRGAPAPTPLIGLSETEVRACAGPPDRSRSRGGVTTLTYGDSAGAAGDDRVFTGSTRGGGGGLGFDPALRSSLRADYCEVRFEIVDGRVADVRYRSSTGSLTGAHGACRSVIERCLAGRQGTPGATAAPDPLDSAIDVE